ncbi:MAG: DNA-binding NarL/FixJ family response regulator [Polyangiales bacterium]
MSDSPIQVLVADDHPIVIGGVRRHLALIDDVFFCAGVSSLQDAVAYCAEHSPDVVVMDVQMPGVDGPVSVEALVATGARVVLFTLREEDALVASLVRGGASAFVSKSSPIPMLIEAIRRVHAGERVFSPTLEEQLKSCGGPPHLALTEREHDVFVLLAGCMTPKEAAFELGVSQSTVYTHADRIRRKLKVSTVAELVQYAKEWGVTV